MDLNYLGFEILKYLLINSNTAIRRVRYEQKMDQLGLSEEEREGRRKKLDQIETQFLRARRIRLTKDTFQTIKVIGRGSFGEVLNRNYVDL